MVGASRWESLLCSGWPGIAAERGPAWSAKIFGRLTKRFQETAYLIGDLFGDAYELATRRYQCARQHIIESLYSHDLLKSGFNQLR